MPYQAEISRTNRTCFVFLIDQSESMKHPIGNGTGQTKAQALADGINRILQALVLRCSSGTLVDRFNIGVIGYGGDEAAPVLGGALAGRAVVSIVELGHYPLRVEKRMKRVPDGIGGFTQTETLFPVWFDPRCGGRTPMCSALRQTRDLLAEFLLYHPDCFPPIIMNFTDGSATDGDPEPLGFELTRMSSTDGNVLLFNALLSAREIAPLEYPDREVLLPDGNARRLFRMSSVLPEPMRVLAENHNIPVRDQSRGFVFNADPVAMAQFIDIGTRPGLR